jgi:WD40 repeat protein
VTTDAAPTRTRAIEDPYVGLTYFTEEYVDLFFGRDEESALVIGNLRASRLTLLYAESGVGKSSVLRAGVVARLHAFAERDRHGAGSPRLVPVVFSSWSERPVAGLVHAVREAIRPYLAEEDLPELPEADLEAALDTASAALDATLLVILDQFEEYFLYPDQAPEPDRVAAQVARCVNRPDLRANFLISIREDSYAELGDLFRGKVKNVYGNFLHLDFLGRAGAREAIEKPIERMNELHPEPEPFAVEPALVDAVLDQVRRDESDERVETTYLQLVMRRLWGEEKSAGSGVLRLATLEKLGGAQAIIGNHLDRAMGAGADGGAGLTPEQRLIAAKIFRFLVTSGGTKIALTADDLAELSDLSRAEIDPVLRHLSSPQLHILRPVVFQEEGSEPRFEIFHDALSEPIRKWRTRVEEEERNARLQRERTEKEAAQRAAAEAERHAEEERRRKRIAQALLALAVLALVGGMTIFAIRQTNLADKRDADKQSIRASERISELAWAPSFGPTPAALASIEAYGLSPTAEARERALGQLQLNPGLPEIIAGHTRGVESVAFWPGSDKLVSGGDGTVRLWNRHGEKLEKPLAAGSAVLEVAVSLPTADGAHFIAAGLQDGGVQLWRVPREGGKAKPALAVAGPEEMRGVAFDPKDAEVLAVGGHGGEVSLWDLGEPHHRLDREKVPGDIKDIAFAPDGKRLFVASTRGGAKLGLSRAGFDGSTLVTYADESSVAAAADGSYAFGGRGGVELWPAGEKPVSLSLPGRVDGLAFARGGAVLVSAGTDWNVTTWDVASRRPFGPPRAANRAPINDVAVSGSGEIAAAGDDRLVKVWPLEPQRALAATLGSLSAEETGGSVPKLYDLAGAGHHKFAIAAGLAGTSIWKLPAWSEVNGVPEPIVRLPAPSFSVASHGYLLVVATGRSFVVYATGGDLCEKGRTYCWVAAAPDRHSESRVNNLVFAYSEGRLLLASSGEKDGEGVVNLWDFTGVRRGGRIEYLDSMKTKSPILGLAFDREKPVVAAATENGELVLWETRHGRLKEFARANPEHQKLFAVAFSSQGALLASGGEGQQVVLWKIGKDGSGNLTAKSTPGTLLQRQGINSLTFSPDGNTLAAADGEGNICLYEVATRHLVGDRSCLRGYNLTNLNGKIEAMKFAHLPEGGTALLTAGWGQPLIAWNSLLWNLHDTTPVDRALENDLCALAGRNMTEYEWKAVFASTDLEENREETCPGKGLPHAHRR